MKRKILSFSLILLCLFTLVSCGKKHIVTFDSNGGSYVEPVEVKHKKKVAEPIKPTFEWHAFIEWQLDGEKYDFSSKVTKDITLVAVWESTLTNQKAADITELPLYIVDKYPEPAHKMASAVLKNKVDVGSLKELLETNPVALIENKELDKTLNFVFLAADALLEIGLLDAKVEKPLETQEYQISLQNIWNEFIKGDYYQSPSQLFKEDKKFVEAIAPIIAVKYYYGKIPTDNNQDETIVFTTMLASPAMRHYFSISRKGENLTFINNVTNNKYSITLSEISKIIEGCESNKSLVQDSLMVLKHFKDQVTYNYYEKAFANLKENDEFLNKELENKTKQLSSTIKGINDAFDIILSYEAKISELASKLDKVQSEEEQHEFIEEARNFALQVIDQCADLLPNNNEIDTMFDVLEEFKSILTTFIEFTEMSVSFGGIEIAPYTYLAGFDAFFTTLSSSRALIKVTIASINSFLDAAKTITTEDIEQILILANDPDNIEATDYVDKLIERLISQIEKVDYSAIFTDQELQEAVDDLSLVFEDYADLLSVALDLHLDEYTAIHIEKYLSIYLEYVTLYNPSKIINLLESAFSNKEINVSLICEMSDFTSYLFDGMDINFFYKFKDSILNIQDLLGTTTLSIEEAYDYIQKNPHVGQAIAGWKIQSIVVSNMIEYIDIANRYKINNQNLELVEKYATKEFEEFIGKCGFEIEIFTEEEIAKLYSMVLKPANELTEEEKKLIMRYENISPIEWYYPLP